ncbi:hypothetical protein LZ554_009547 [Drepanopeziza brunnea f. sp. 'monogermtubi']|nr:hypothetical protein LZ554_009547 [Drepanopeziza brunnea f. sp. 'monogermtubi']
MQLDIGLPLPVGSLLKRSVPEVGRGEVFKVREDFLSYIRVEDGAPSGQRRRGGRAVVGVGQAKAKHHGIAARNERHGAKVADDECVSRQADPTDPADARDPRQKLVDADAAAID